MSMSAKLRCPYCDRTFDLEQVERAELFDERAEVAARLGRAWRLANEYVECFRQSSDGRIMLKTRVRLLNDVVRLWEGCLYEYDGRRYRTTQEQIAGAMATVCNVGKRGFLNHNYLKKVLISTSVRVSAEGMTAAEEERRERVRREKAKSPPAPLCKGGGGSLFPEGDVVEEPITAKEFKRRRGIESLAGQIGRVIE